MHALLAKRKDHFARHVVRALHEIHDHRDVADSLASVVAQIAVHVMVLGKIARLVLAQEGRQIIALHIVRVDVLARRDGARGRADRRAVFHDLLSRGDGPRRDLVPERQARRHLDLRIADADARARFERRDHRQHIIGGVQAQQSGIGGNSHR